jgi:hypothetical protein
MVYTSNPSYTGNLGRNIMIWSWSGQKVLRPYMEKKKKAKRAGGGGAQVVEHASRTWVQTPVPPKKKEERKAV